MNNSKSEHGLHIAVVIKDSWLKEKHLPFIRLVDHQL